MLQLNYEQFAKSFSWFKQNRDSSILTMAGGIVTLYVALVELSLILSNGGLPQSQYILYYVTGLLPAILEIFLSVLMWVYNSRSGLWGILTILVAFVCRDLGRALIIKRNGERVTLSLEETISMCRGKRKL